MTAPGGGLPYDYDFEALLDAYSRLGVKPGGLVYVASDIARLMRYREAGREASLSAHLRALQELLGPSGTIFVPTASLNLCNTSIVFDPATTRSSDMGVFSEYVRTTAGSVRSFHPFWSLAGLGPAAAEMLGGISRHCYGWNSVFHRFVERDVLGLNIGVPPPRSISIIHHIETVVGVPYRYNKEFMHPVKRDAAVEVEPFYVSVLYRNSDIRRDSNRKIFDNFARKGLLNEAKIGRGAAWSFSCREFFDVTAELFRQDIYCWLESPPQTRPYQA